MVGLRLTIEDTHVLKAPVINPIPPPYILELPYSTMLLLIVIECPAVQRFVKQIFPPIIVALFFEKNTL